MHPFIELCLQRAAKIDLKVANLPEPTGVVEKEKGEEVIGELSDDLKRLFLVMVYVRSDLTKRCRADVPVNMRTMPEILDGFGWVLESIMAYINCVELETYFWERVTIEFRTSFSGVKDIGLRRQWTVVKLPEPKGQSS